jgi:hypothetical protein
VRYVFNLLVTPNFWVFVATLLAIAGQVCLVLGFLIADDALVKVGLWLFLPLISGALLIVFVVVPLLILHNRKRG